MKFSMTGQKKWSLNRGDCLIEVTAWAGLTRKDRLSHSQSWKVFLHIDLLWNIVESGIKHQYTKPILNKHIFIEGSMKITTMTENKMILNF
jgi:hypothetical protein